MPYFSHIEIQMTLEGSFLFVCFLFHGLLEVSLTLAHLPSGYQIKTMTPPLSYVHAHQAWYVYPLPDLSLYPVNP